MSIDCIEMGSFGAPTPLSLQPPRLKVVSWNIARGSHFDAIRKFLINANADLVLLQESDRNCRRTEHRNVAKDIAKILGMHYVFGIEFQELGQGSRDSPAYHGQATLSRWPLAEPRIIRFRSQSKFWHSHWWIPPIAAFQRRIGGRMALLTHLVVENRSLMVYNLHLESRNANDLRYSQLAELLEDARQYDLNNEVLVAGDFNFDFTAITHNSAVQKAGFENPFATLSGLSTISSSSGQKRAIDWLLIRGAAKAQSARVHDSVKASDHYPLVLTLRL
jgi:endonuclease/exonuclease/phosphatase family metal-dependent hydrolase